MRKTRLDRARLRGRVLIVIAAAVAFLGSGVVADASSSSPTAVAQTACTAPAWASTPFYNQGDTVSHNGRQWRANSWLWPGVEPGVSGAPPWWVPWADLGPCGSTTTTTSTTTPSSTTTSTPGSTTTTTVPGGPPSPPAQPTSGPGGSNYPHGDWIVSSGGTGNDAWYVFQPTNPRPASAPVAIITHGYGEFSGFDTMYELIRHTVRKGNVVVYPRWQTDLASPCPGPFNIEPCMTSTVNGIRGGLDWLQADPANRVQPQLDKASYFGFSFGGIITANLANRHASLGLPVPKAMLLDDIHDGGLAGAGEPALDDSMSGIPSTVRLNCHSGAAGVISEAGKQGSSCNALFPMLGHIPNANKDLVLTYTDTHGDPDLSSEHGVCSADPGDKDAYDFYFCWKVWDALRSSAFDGTDSEYALGNTPEHRFNGLWSDGTPVRELKIQDAAPIAP